MADPVRFWASKAFVLAADTDFMITFFQVQGVAADTKPGQTEVQVNMGEVGTVVMSPMLAKELIEQLQSTLDGYEQRRGKLPNPITASPVVQH